MTPFSMRRLTRNFARLSDTDTELLPNIKTTLFVQITKANSIELVLTGTESLPDVETSEFLLYEMCHLVLAQLSYYCYFIKTGRNETTITSEITDEFVEMVAEIVGELERPYSESVQSTSSIALCSMLCDVSKLTVVLDYGDRTTP